MEFKSAGFDKNIDARKHELAERHFNRTRTLIFPQASRKRKTLTPDILQTTDNVKKAKTSR